MEKSTENKKSPTEHPKIPASKVLNFKEEDADPVKAALARIETVVSKTGKHIEKEPIGNGALGDSVSLKQIIDRMEQKLKSSSSLFDSKSAGLPEELESLDIEADLGRPDATEKSSVPPDAAMIGEIQKQEPSRSQESESPKRASNEFRGLRFADGLRNSGNLRDDPVWILLLAVFTDKRKGRLVLDRSGVVRKLYFSEGRISTATSTAPEDHFAELLHRQGRLNDEEYHRARLAVGVGQKRAGAILAECGIISQRELFPLVRHHYESIVFDSFKWRDGTWRFESDKEEAERRILLDVPTPALIFEGMRLKAPPEDIEKIVPSGCRLRSVSRGSSKAEEFDFEPSEADIYRACDGLVTVNELANRFGASETEMKRFVAGLVVLGLLDANPPDTYRQNTEDGL